MTYPTHHSEEVTTAARPAHPSAPALADIDRLLAANAPVGTLPPRSRARRPSKWTEERIADELERFLAGRTTRPSAAEWKQAGLGGLHQLLTARGELGDWLERFGLAASGVQRWDERRLRGELTAFVAGFSHWPTWREFREAGRGKLCAAAAYHGGLAYWAAEFGLERRPARRRKAPDAS